MSMSAIRKAGMCSSLRCGRSQGLALLDHIGCDHLATFLTRFGVVDGPGRHLIGLAYLQGLVRLSFDQKHEVAVQDIAGLRARMRMPPDARVRCDLSDADDRLVVRARHIELLEWRSLDRRVRWPTCLLGMERARQVERKKHENRRKLFEHATHPLLPPEARTSL